MDGSRENVIFSQIVLECINNMFDGMFQTVNKWSNNKTETVFMVLFA